MITLDVEEAEYLKSLMSKTRDIFVDSPFFWARDKLLKKLEEQNEEEENRKNCVHLYGEYVGKKRCCIKCGGYGEGMGFEWTLKSEH